jgi:hypothetical protein
MGEESPKPARTPTRAVFLSYASQDTEAAQRICAALRSAGVEVWFDQSELRGGDAWDHSIRRQIKTCALFVPIVSRHTHERAEGYFRLEWKLAVDRSHLIMANKAFLLPVVIDDTDDDDEHVYTLTGTQLNGPSDASGYGDDAQSNENFPIVRLQNAAGLVFYCRSRNWTSTGVGNVGQESVKFTLNPAVTPGDYQLIVSAGGISSKPWPIHIPGHGD